jgi:hypothetical protein
MIDKTMAKRIATLLGWAPVDNETWKYNPMTGEPLVDGWPLYSGLPIKLQDVRESVPESLAQSAQIKGINSTTERNIQLSKAIPVESAWMKGYIMNQEYTADEADAWINGHRVGQKKGDQLRLAVKEFFDKYLDVVEESDSGRIFSPITINCCRALKLEPLGKLLTEMRELSGAELKDDNV